MRPSRSLRSAGYDPRDPLSLDESIDFAAGLRPVDQGLEDRLQRRFRRLSGRSAQLPRWSPRPCAPSRRPARIVEPVKFGIRHSQRELSDAWSRLMMPLNLGTFEAVKAAGLDLLGEHRDDFPPEYLHWIEVGQKMTIDGPVARPGDPQRGLRRRPGGVRHVRPDRHADAGRDAGARTATTATRSARAR